MDREAEFRRLYQVHRAAVHAYFTGRTGDAQSAADLMQEVFLRAWQHLEKLTGMLDDRQRATLTMAAAGGMTSAELAAALGVPAGTVRYRLSLARRAVAEALDRYDDPAEK